MDSVWMRRIPEANLIFEARPVRYRYSFSRNSRPLHWRMALCLMVVRQILAVGNAEQSLHWRRLKTIRLCIALVARFPCTPRSG
jgi:hypothetical protein